MKIERFILVIIPIFFFSCQKTPVAVHKITGKQLNISDSITANTAITDFITPYKDHLNKVLDSPLAYSPKTLSLSYKDELNIAIGNLMADIIFEQANPVFKNRSGKDIDFVLLNYGGIRDIISKGNVTTRTAYEIMPFENNIVVVELTIEKIESMLNYLAAQKKPHPLSSQINIILNNKYELKKVTIHRQPPDKNKTYYVATSDYLMNLGDNMVFFSNPVSVTETGYLMRNAIIDYFKKTDTVTAVIDNRFIKAD